MSHGGKRDRAGRKPIITDPVTIVEIAAAFGNEWWMRAVDNALDTIAHRTIPKKLYGVSDPAKRRQIIGNRPRLFSARIKRPYGLKPAIVADLAKRFGISKRRVEYCIKLIPPKLPFQET